MTNMASGFVQCAILRFPGFPSFPISKKSPRHSYKALDHTFHCPVLCCRPSLALDNQLVHLLRIANTVPTHKKKGPRSRPFSLASAHHMPPTTPSLHYCHTPLSQSPLRTDKSSASTELLLLLLLFIFFCLIFCIHSIYPHFYRHIRVGRRSEGRKKKYHPFSSSCYSIQASSRE